MDKDPVSEDQSASAVSDVLQSHVMHMISQPPSLDPSQVPVSSTSPRSITKSNIELTTPIQSEGNRPKSPLSVSQISAEDSPTIYPAAPQNVGLSPVELSYAQRMPLSEELSPEELQMLPFPTYYIHYKQLDPLTKAKYLAHAYLIITEAKRKRKDQLSGGAKGDEYVRIPMWNGIRKTSGFASPLMKNLINYLQDHPDCEIYDKYVHGRYLQYLTGTLSFESAQIQVEYVEDVVQLAPPSVSAKPGRKSKKRKGPAQKKKQAEAEAQAAAAATAASAAIIGLSDPDSAPVPTGLIGGNDMAGIPSSNLALPQGITSIDGVSAAPEPVPAIGVAGDQSEPPPVDHLTPSAPTHQRVQLVRLKPVFSITFPQRTGTRYVHKPPMPQNDGEMVKGLEPRRDGTESRRSTRNRNAANEAQYVYEAPVPEPRPIRPRGQRPIKRAPPQHITRTATYTGYDDEYAYQQQHYPQHGGPHKYGTSAGHHHVGGPHLNGMPVSTVASAPVYGLPPPQPPNSKMKRPRRGGVNTSEGQPALSNSHSGIPVSTMENVMSRENSTHTSYRHHQNVPALFPSFSQSGVPSSSGPQQQQQQQQQQPPSAGGAASGGHTTSNNPSGYHFLQTATSSHFPQFNSSLLSATMNPLGGGNQHQYKSVAGAPSSMPNQSESNNNTNPNTTNNTTRENGNHLESDDDPTREFKRILQQRSGATVGGTQTSGIVGPTLSAFANPSYPSLRQPFQMYNPNSSQIVTGGLHSTTVGAVLGQAGSNVNPSGNATTTTATTTTAGAQGFLDQLQPDSIGSSFLPFHSTSTTNNQTNTTATATGITTGGLASAFSQQQTATGLSKDAHMKLLIQRLSPNAITHTTNPIITAGTGNTASSIITGLGAATSTAASTNFFGMGSRPPSTFEPVSTTAGPLSTQNATTTTAAGAASTSASSSASNSGNVLSTTTTLPTATTSTTTGTSNVSTTGGSTHLHTTLPSTSSTLPLSRAFSSQPIGGTASVLQHSPAKVPSLTATSGVTTASTFLMQRNGLGGSGIPTTLNGNNGTTTTGGGATAPTAAGIGTDLVSQFPVATSDVARLLTSYVRSTPISHHPQLLQTAANGQAAAGNTTTATATTTTTTGVTTLPTLSQTNSIVGVGSIFHHATANSTALTSAAGGATGLGGGSTTATGTTLASNPITTQSLTSTLFQHFPK